MVQDHPEFAAAIEAVDLGALDIEVAITRLTSAAARLLFVDPKPQNLGMVHGLTGTAALRLLLPRAGRLRPRRAILAIALPHTRAQLFLAIGLAVLGAAGCDVLERWACGEPCVGGVSPAHGAIEDFTLAGHREAQALVTEVALCDEVGGGLEHVVYVTTDGNDTEVAVGDWLADGVLV